MHKMKIPQILTLIPIALQFDTSLPKQNKK